MRKIRVLHIVKDEKFFDDMVICFESKPIYQNSYILETNTKKYEFVYIRNTKVVEVLWNKNMISERFLKNDYDVIFFHSIQPSFYKYFKFINKDKIVIWWAWGYDLYSPLYGTSPFLNVDLLKPLTHEICCTTKRRLIDFIKRTLRRNIIRQRKEWIKRIDYFNPVIHLEYELMKKVPGFKAKEYHYPFKLTVSQDVIRGNDILIGNSAAYENNHLDIWNLISPNIPKGSSVIFPLSYGDKKYAEYIKNNIQSESINLCFIMDFMPKEKYFNLISNCSFAIFGAVRQMSMGNIYYCLQSGVKLFLFKNSIIYRHLCNMGYIVFPLEEVNSNSFLVPLTPQEILQNKNAFWAEQRSKLNLEEQFEKDFFT